MENYILRIYRRDEVDPDNVVGLVEPVEKGEPQPFRTLTELTAILAGTSTMMEESVEEQLCCESA